MAAMWSGENRFECIPGPDGTWTVWDYLAGRPACLNGILIGCSEFRADAAKQMLANEFGSWTEKNLPVHRRHARPSQTNAHPMRTAR